MSVEEQAPKPLRIGLLLDGWRQPAWVHRLVSLLTGSDHTNIDLVVVPDGEPPPVRAESAHWLYHAYLGLDRRLFPSRPDPFVRSDLAPLLGGCTQVRVEPPQREEGWELPEYALRAIRGQDPDLLLCLGTCRPGTPLVARHGTWACHPDTSLSAGGRPWGFWEVMEGATSSDVLITRLGADGSDEGVIHRSSGPTCWYSVHRNRANAAWKTADLLEHKLRQLAAGLLVAADGRDGPGQRAAPGNWRISGLVGRLAVRFAREGLERALYRRQWCLAYGTQGFAGTIDPTFRDYRYLIPPVDRFWGDPFPLRVEGRTCLFFEEYVWSERRGRIAAVEQGPDGDFGPPVTVLDVPPHLSYPFVFEWQGAAWMIPDTARRQVVELYRCRSFPDRWELETTLLEGIRAADSSLVRWKDRWWLFAVVAPEGSRLVDELHLFQAPSPLGPWTPHALNPVKSDVRSARPAGRPFVHDAELYRPSQDCSRHYGGALLLNNVVELSEKGFREVEVARLDPDWRSDVMGLHTLNSIEGLTVIDCRLKRPRWHRT